MVAKNVVKVSTQCKDSPPAKYDRHKTKPCCHHQMVRRCKVEEPICFVSKVCAYYPHYNREPEQFCSFFHNSNYLASLIERHTEHNLECCFKHLSRKGATVFEPNNKLTVDSCEVHSSMHYLLVFNFGYLFPLPFTGRAGGDQ